MNNPNPQFSKAYLTTMYLSNIKIIEAMSLKLLNWGPLEWHYINTKFHENLPSGSEVISGGPTDRQIGDLISLLSFLKSMLKMYGTQNTLVGCWLRIPGLCDLIWSCVLISGVRSDFLWNEIITNRTPVLIFLAYFPKMKVGLSYRLSVCYPLVTFEPLDRISWNLVWR
jgi:hypothetical protein